MKLIRSIDVDRNDFKKLKKMAIVYPYDGNLYLAITKRCTLACTFCPKTHGRWVVAGNDMSRDIEPDPQLLLKTALEADPSQYRETAFVGLGEPTLRLPVVTDVGKELRARGHRVRLVTDGLANLRFEEDITPDLSGAVDEVHVSLNAPDGETYAKICPSRHGSCAHEAVCDFIIKVKNHVPEVSATVVALPGLDLDRCRSLAQSLDVPLRIRPFFDPSDGNPHDDGSEI